MDIRMEFIGKFERMLADRMDADSIAMASNVVTLLINEYEIQERCTEVAIRDTTNDELLKMYAGNLIVQGKSYKTVKAYIYMLRRFSDYIGKNLTEVTTYDIRRYIALYLNSGHKNSTVGNVRNYLSAFYQFLLAEEIIDRNPMAKIKPLKKTSIKEDPFSDMDVARIRDTELSKRNRAIVEFLLGTGVRVSEMCDMKLSDIDLTESTVKVMHGKGDKYRVTYITTVGKMYLEEYLKTRKDDSEYLFVPAKRGRDRLESGGVRVILNDISAISGVKNIHPHRFRHTFATNMARQGMPVEAIQMLLGHSDINTTMVYVKISQENIKHKFAQIVN